MNTLSEREIFTIPKRKLLELQAQKIRNLGIFDDVDDVDVDGDYTMDDLRKAIMGFKDEDLIQKFICELADYIISLTYFSRDGLYSSLGFLPAYFTSDKYLSRGKIKTVLSYKKGKHDNTISIYIKCKYGESENITVISNVLEDQNEFSFKNSYLRFPFLEFSYQDMFVKENFMNRKFDFTKEEYRSGIIEACSQKWINNLETLVRIENEGV